jgi:thiol-disulfide isomerase/thioredoxin
MRAWAVAMVLVLVLVGFDPSAWADAAGDWAQIDAMEQNAPSAQWKTREEMQAGALDYLGKQEVALRAYIAAYPDDAHTPDAKLRLAHLLATRADLKPDPRDKARAEALLDELEREPVMKDRRADVEFARVSIFMQQVDEVTGRDALLEKARAFAKEFPDDHRVAALLTEVASVYDDAPKTARALLEQAQPKAKTPELQARIADDLKRLALLGKPLKMAWTSVQGPRIDLETLRGKVVLIYFFASWSGPSMMEMDWVKNLAASGGADALQTLGICLDSDPVTVPDMLAQQGIAWPVYCDGRGWQGTLVRGLGVNALPQLWIVDKEGVVLSLDAKQDAEALIDRGLRRAE